MCWNSFVKLFCLLVADLLQKCLLEALVCQNAADTDCRALNALLCAGVVSLYYSSSFSPQTYEHYNAGQGWTTPPGKLMGASTDPRFPGFQYLSVAANSLTFVFNDGNGHWDNNVRVRDAIFVVTMTWCCAGRPQLPSELSGHLHRGQGTIPLFVGCH